MDVSMRSPVQKTERGLGLAASLRRLSLVFFFFFGGGGWRGP